MRRSPAEIEGRGHPEDGQEHGDGAPEDGFLSEGQLEQSGQDEEQRGQRGDEVARQGAVVEEEHRGEDGEGRESEGQRPSCDGKLVPRAGPELPEGQEAKGGEDGRQREQGGRTAPEGTRGVDAELEFAGSEPGEAEKFVGDEGDTEERESAAVVAAPSCLPGDDVVSGETEEENQGDNAGEPEGRLFGLLRASAGHDQDGEGQNEGTGPNDTKEAGGQHDHGGRSKDG